MVLKWLWFPWRKKKKKVSPLHCPFCNHVLDVIIGIRRNDFWMCSECDRSFLDKTEIERGIFDVKQGEELKKLYGGDEEVIYI